MNGIAQHAPIQLDLADMNQSTIYSPLWKKLALVLALLVSLWMVSDGDGFTVFTALQQHMPSNRIFRALLQANLMLWCTAFSLWIWSRTFPVEVIGDFLFQPVLASFSSTGTNSSPYQLVGEDSVARGEHEVMDASDNAVDEEVSDHHVEEEDAEDLVNITIEDTADDDEGEGHDTSLKIHVPTAFSVTNSAFDMLLIILVTLVIYSISAAGFLSSQEPWRMLSHVAAPTFPLLLFVYFCVQALHPWSQKGGLWILVGITTTAPWHPVTFRDGFIGDVLTSSVRPLQDVAFTVFYIMGGLRGWWSQDYFNSDSFLDRADASVPRMEKSWFYYTIVLPMCLVSPLWWRFLQNLRQTFDAKQRWPYLGNAAKYFCAAQVAVVGIFFPSQRHSKWWLCSFVVATLYQIWWDVFMDWELFERHHGRWQLRSRRMYSSTKFYWLTCAVNIVLRFCWTLTFLPPRYLDVSGVLRQNLGGDLSFVLSPLIASAEIVRRTLWGLLRLEWEAVKNEAPRADQEFKESIQSMEEPNDDGVEMTPMKLQDMAMTSLSTSNRSNTSFCAKDMTTMSDGQVLGELSVYATVFAILGALAAAHRGTL